MTKKILLLSVILCLAFSGPALATPFCDSFGKDWDISFAPCPDVEGVICVTGCRDCSGSMGCGEFPVDGTLTLDLISRGYVLSVTSYDNPDNTCVSAHWNAKFIGSTFQGAVSNENGSSWTFTLAPGPCPAGAKASEGDPAQP